MTRLPTELITTKCSSSSYSEGHCARKTPQKRFKECLSQDRSSRDDDQRTHEDEEEASSVYSLFSQPMQPVSTQAPCTAAALPVSNCTEVAALFEKMAATMLIMDSAGERETTLILNSDQFATSALFGTRITIKEFSTAPKVFNIEIAADPTALNLLTTHKDALLAAFENHKLPYSVHRLDTELHAMDKEERASTSQEHTEDELS
jgi:hypothetical protein